MKKILSTLGAISLSMMVTIPVVACAKHDNGSNTLNIEGKIVVNGASINLSANSGKTNEDFLDEENLLTAVSQAFLNSSNDKLKGAVLGTDYEISVANPSANQIAGNLQFTIKGIGDLTGKINFIVNIK